MEEYIKKSALVAEIERRISDNKKDIERASHKNLEDYFEGYEDALVLLKEKFIDTFEVKEVDLEKELDYVDYINFFNEHPDYNNNDWGFDEAWMFANYFFKLGMQVSNKQIEEKKNIDSLEEKCNTIYKDITMINKDGNTINAKIEQREKI